MIKKPRECRVKQPKLGYGLHYVLIKPKWKAINFHLKNFLLDSLISYSSKQQLYKSPALNNLSIKIRNWVMSSMRREVKHAQQ